LAHHADVPLTLPVGWMAAVNNAASAEATAKGDITHHHIA